MTTDQEYFEKYFAVCELLVEKQLLNERLWDGDKAGHLSKIHYQCLGDIRTLNELILDEEARLRAETAVAQEKGVVFAFELFAHKNGLSPFDRRVVLFFLHLDLFRDVEVAFGRRKLAPVLDCEGTPLARSSALLDLFPGSRLFRRKIIATVLGETQVRLAVPLRDKLRHMVCGRKAGVVRRQKEVGMEDEIEVGKIAAPEYRMEDVVLAPAKLQEVLLHVETHQQMISLGTMKNAQRGKGLGMLFYGPPGTGKSMLAHALAAHLKKKVLQVSVSEIKSKYVGDSEKRIVQLFALAREKDCVVCFDEADSLIMSRTEAVRSWEISQVNVFLEELEKFKGILIMTSNLETRLDPALERRLALRVRFDIPGAEVRREIWQKHVPASVKLGADIDWKVLGEKFSFPGGYIKNAVLSAIRHMLARKGEILMMEDLLFGAKMEQDGRLGKKSGLIGFAGTVQGAALAGREG